MAANELKNPRDKYSKPPYNLTRSNRSLGRACQQNGPFSDHGEQSYRGSGRLKGRKALITGGDSGMGRAAAIAFVREGADVAINYFPTEEPDAEQVIAPDQGGRPCRIGDPGRPQGGEILLGAGSARY